MAPLNCTDRISFFKFPVLLVQLFYRFLSIDHVWWSHNPLSKARIISTLQIKKFRFGENKWPGQVQSINKCRREIRIQIFSFPSLCTTQLHLAEYHKEHWTFSVPIEGDYGLQNLHILWWFIMCTWYQIPLKCRAPWTSFLFP